MIIAVVAIILLSDRCRAINSPVGIAIIIAVVIIILSDRCRASPIGTTNIGVVVIIMSDCCRAINNRYIKY